MAAVNQGTRAVYSGMKQYHIYRHRSYRPIPFPNSFLKSNKDSKKIIYFNQKIPDSSYSVKKRGFRYFTGYNWIKCYLRC